MTATQRPPSPPPIMTGGDAAFAVPAWGFLRRNRHWTVPPLLVPLFAMAGFALAGFRAHTTALAASAVSVLAVWFFAPHKWDRKREQWYARLSVLAAAAWLSAASFTGLTWIMAAVLAGLVLVWGCFWFWHKRPRARIGDKASVREWNDWWQHYSRNWSVPGSAVAEVGSKGTMETLTVQLWAGRQTVRQLADATELIESALAGYVRPGGVRVDRDPHDPSRALVRLKREDPLAVPSGWHPGLAITSITEPAPVGFTESGEIIRVSLLANWFVIGKTRGGKSNELSEILASITGCDDALAWLVDMKGGRAARPWMPAVDWCAVTIDEAEAMFTVLKDEIKGRATFADDSEEQLRPTREVPAIYLVIDETYEVTSVSAGVARLASMLAVIASQGSGVAIHVIVVTQYGALDESVRTEQTRSNLVNRICFAVTQAAHGAFALTDWDKLNASKLREKGSFYLQLGPDASSAPGRGHRMDHVLVRQIAARHGAMPRPKLTLYASQHQETYDARWSRLPQPFWRSAPQCDDMTPSPAAPKETPVIDPIAQAGIDATAHAMAARIEDEVADLPDVNPARPPTDDDLRNALERSKHQFARALADAPPAGIEPKQLIKACGLSRAWVMGQLKALTETGVVIKPGSPDSHTYRAGNAEEVLAAIKDSRRRDDALLVA